MSDLLGIGASGVRGYSRALQTIGDNIANAQTAGFARRNTVLAEQIGSGQSVLYRNQIAPNGVVVSGVGRSVDPWLVNDARAAAADAANTGARLRGLDAAETVVDDGGVGVGTVLTAFFNRADELAVDPADTTRRSAFVGAVDDVAGAFRRTADGLSRAASGVTREAATTVDQLNSDLTALARVNDGLRRARDGSTNQATLLDSRDRLIDSISTTLNVDVAYEPTGAAELSVGGTSLLSGSQVATVSVNEAADGRLTLSALLPGGAVLLAPASGALSGQVFAADHIATLRTQLDTQAQNLATSLNAQHAAGRDPSGNPGVALLQVVNGAAGIASLIGSPADVAAADGAGANGNALSFGNLRGGGGSEANWATFAAQLSQNTAQARSRDTAASARNDGAATARADMSGVDLDREAADLVRYQQAYEASARVIQVARETMQTILNAL